MATEATKKRFTVDEYYKMVDAGIFTAGERVELVGGEIIQMSAMGAPHADALRGISALLMAALAGRARVSVQLPVHLDDFNEPEPDISVVGARSYRASHPGPDDVFLVIEVADSSLNFDREVKTRTYAAAGIRETWVVDLNGDAVLIFRDPSPSGYRELRTLGRGASIAPEAFEDVTFLTDEILNR